MKSRTLLATLFVFPIIFASCSTKDDASTTSATSDYPLMTCVVSGEPLGSMGEPIVYEHNGTTVKFCCDKCLPKFKNDPETYIAKVTRS